MSERYAEEHPAGGKRMNHTEAISTGAVERYLLGQLSASESEEFEQHFFDCLECARDLRAGAIFEENARSVFLDEGPLPEPSPRTIVEKPPFWTLLWQRPWSAAPAFASVLLAAVAAYQAWVVIPGLRGRLNDALAPQPVVSHVLPPISRGDSRVLEVPQGSLFYTIYMDPTWEGSFAAYDCSIIDESGATKVSLRLPTPPPGKPLEILLARSLLPSGRYTVVVHPVAESGKSGLELARYALIVKLD
jgi:hypothetical protein